MSRETSNEAARRLMIRYLNQLREAGEDEIFMPRDLLSSLAASSRGPGRSQANSFTARRDEERASRSATEDGAAQSASERTARSAARRGVDSSGGASAGTRSGSSGGASTGTRSGSSDGASTGTRPGSANSGRSASGSTSSPSPSELAAGLPDPEIIECDLAFGGPSSQSDMFGQPSSLEACPSLEQLDKLTSSCRKCELATTRTNVVFGVGNPKARLMFVGEAPGRDEDEQGIPFVGRAGQLLNKILEAVEIKRDDVYIGNIIKCRPPGNRTPLTNEIESCIPFLGKQIEFIEPRIICTLGLPATQTLLGIRGSMGSLRGKHYTCRDLLIIPTYHPAAALRDPKYKRPLWEDFLLLKKQYDLS